MGKELKQVKCDHCGRLMLIKQTVYLLSSDRFTRLCRLCFKKYYSRKILKAQTGTP
jgi:hypothetical protein